MGEPKDKAKRAEKDGGALTLYRTTRGRFSSQNDDGNPSSTKPNSSTNGTSARVLKSISQTHSAALARLKDR